MLGLVGIAEGDRCPRFPAVGELQQHEVLIRVVALARVTFERKCLLHGFGVDETRLKFAHPLGIHGGGLRRVHLGVAADEIFAAAKRVELSPHVGELALQHRNVRLVPRRGRHPVPVGDPVGMLGNHLLLLFVGQRIPPRVDVLRSYFLALRRIRRGQSGLVASHLLGSREIRGTSGSDVAVLEMAEHLGAVGVYILGLMD